MAYQGKHAGLSLTAQLNLNISNFASNLAKASTSMSKFAKTTATQYGDLGKKLHSIGLGLRDVGRIASGIMISQTFYRGAQAIRDATSALTGFNEALDYAKVSYTALFGSEDIASSFLETLKEQAINTMFSFEDLTEASKKLLAYGIDYKNIGYITEGLTSLASISGDSAAIDRLSYALGQIYAKGKLSAEEMRQLANAYVPIQQILKERLGVQKDDLNRVGDLNIPAEQAINAIVDYANDNFGNVADAAMLTITGLKSKIADTFKVTGSEMMQPMTKALKSFLNWFNNSLDDIRQAYLNGGFGGVFEYLVPNESTQQRLRQFIATISNMLTSLIRLIVSIIPIVKRLVAGLVDAFNIIQPAFTFTYNLLAAGISIISKNTFAMKLLTTALVTCAAAWVLFKVKAISALAITMLTKGFYALSRAVMVFSTALVAHPIIAVLGAIAAVLVGVAAGSDKVKNKISQLADKFSGLYNGLKSDDVLQLGDGLEKTASDADKFNNKLGDSADAIENLEKTAAKAKKGLLSFDEVFKLNDTKDEGGIDNDLSGMLDGLNLGDVLLPTIPDFSDYTDKFVDSLFGSLWDSVSRIASGAAGGALVGGLVGFAIGGLVTKTMAGALEGAKWGAKIGTAVGGGFAAFWGDAYSQMEDAVNKIITGGSSGALAGGLVGMVIAAFATTKLKGKARMDAIKEGGALGAAIGATLGIGLGGFWSIAEDGFENSLQSIVAGSAAGSLIGGLAGLVIGAFATKTLAGALTGAKWGTAIGTLIGGALGGFWGSASDEMKEKIESITADAAEGALAGGLAGLVIGAFVTRTLSGALAGAKWGAAIGGLLGGALGTFFDTAEGTFIDKLKKMFEDIKVASYTMLIGGLVGLIVGAIVGAMAGGIGAVPGAKAGAAIGAAAGGLHAAIMKGLLDIDVNQMIDDWLNGKKVDSGDTRKLIGYLLGFEGVAGALVGAVVSWWPDIKEGLDTIGENVSSWFKETGERISTWWSDTKQGFSDWATNTKESISNWATETKTNISNWYTNTKSNIANWTVETAAKVGTWYTNTKAKVSNWTVETAAKVGTWYTNTKAKVSNWTVETAAKIGTWYISTKTNISNWAVETSGKLVNWYNNTKTGMSNWVANTKKSLKDWWSSIWNPDTWKSGWSCIKSWFSRLFTDIGNWFKDIGKSISSWWSGLWSDKEVKASNNFGGGGSGGSFSLSGHATGGIFTREHIARFAEGNRAEAVIPLQNAAAMQPFVDAISGGIISNLAPMMTGGQSESLPPVYVGTLIADDNGLKQLERKLKVIRVKEERRGS